MLWGGTLGTNIRGVCGECAQCLSHAGFAPALRACAFIYTAQAPDCSAGNCLVACTSRLSHSGSGSRGLHKGADPGGPACCALPRSEQLRRPGAWRAHSPQVGGASYHLPDPSCSVLGVQRARVSGVLPVSSGQLISGCEPPGRCQPSRIPGRLS